jgi:hypothetical protein
MAYDIITIEPTVSDGAHAAADVIFNLTEVILPARACKLVNWSLEVNVAAAAADDSKQAMLFFQKNTQPTLGTLNGAASISVADFKANKYIGSAFTAMTDNAAALDKDVIDNAQIFYPTDAFMDVTPHADSFGSNGGVLPLVLKGDAGNSKVYVGMVNHVGGIDLDGTDTVRIQLHVEY